MLSRETLERLSDRAGERFADGRGRTAGLSEKQRRLVEDTMRDLRARAEEDRKISACE